MQPPDTTQTPAAHQVAHFHEMKNGRVLKIVRNIDPDEPRPTIIESAHFVNGNVPLPLEYLGAILREFQTHADQENVEFLQTLDLSGDVSIGIEFAPGARPRPVSMSLEKPPTSCARCPDTLPPKPTAAPADDAAPHTLAPLDEEALRKFLTGFKETRRITTRGGPQHPAFAAMEKGKPSSPKRTRARRKELI